MIRSKFARCWSNFLQSSLERMCWMGHKCGINVSHHHHHHHTVIVINIVINSAWYFYLATNLMPLKPDARHYG